MSDRRVTALVGLGVIAVAACAGARLGVGWRAAASTRSTTGSLQTEPPPRVVARSADVPALDPGLVARLGALAAECDLGEPVCHSSADDTCLEAVEASAGEVAFRYRDRAQWDGDGRVPLPHFLLMPMRRLRNAFARAVDGSEMEERCGGLLRSEIAYLRSTLIDRDGALVWESEDGLAQAIEQAEWAHLFASIASVLRNQGSPSEAEAVADVALSMASSLDLPVGRGSGGVRAGERECEGPGLAARRCFWFTSRGLGVRTEGTAPRFVLNQHLHAVHDSLLLYETLVPMIGPDAPEARRALDRAAGGLAVLAFGTPSRSRPSEAAPTLERFVDERRGDDERSTSTWAFYELDPEDGRGLNITNARTCHYHAHVLQLLANISSWIDAPGRDAVLRSAEGRALRAAIDALLERDGIVHRFWRAQSHASARAQRGCPAQPLDPNAFTRQPFYEGRFGGRR